MFRTTMLTKATDFVHETNFSYCIENGLSNQLFPEANLRSCVHDKAFRKLTRNLY